MTSLPGREELLARVEGASDHWFWLELREPRRVPERKGPFQIGDTAKVLREFMSARPEAFITVVTVADGVPLFQDGPECLQMADGRSMETGRKHIASSAGAHSPDPTAAFAAWLKVGPQLAKAAGCYVGITVSALLRATASQTISPATEQDDE